MAFLTSHYVALSQADDAHAGGAQMLLQRAGSPKARRMWEHEAAAWMFDDVGWFSVSAKDVVSTSFNRGGPQHTSTSSTRLHRCLFDII